MGLLAFSKPQNTYHFALVFQWISNEFRSFSWNVIHLAFVFPMFLRGVSALRKTKVLPWVYLLFRSPETPIISHWFFQWFPNDFRSFPWNFTHLAFVFPLFPRGVPGLRKTKVLQWVYLIFRSPKSPIISHWFSQWNPNDFRSFPWNSTHLAFVFPLFLRGVSALRKTKVLPWVYLVFWRAQNDKNW